MFSIEQSLPISAAILVLCVVWALFRRKTIDLDERLFLRAGAVAGTVGFLLWPSLYAAYLFTAHDEKIDLCYTDMAHYDVAKQTCAHISENLSLGEILLAASVGSVVTLLAEINDFNTYLKESRHPAPEPPTNEPSDSSV